MLVQRCRLEHHRLIIPVGVGKPHLQSGAFASSFPVDQYRALVDTGAQRTVLSRTLISKHNLLRVGHIQFASLHGPKTHSRFLAAITLWAKRVNDTDTPHDFERAEITPFVIDDPFEVVDMDDNTNFDLILGFDVLRSFSFGFDSPNQTFQIFVK